MYLLVIILLLLSLAVYKLNRWRNYWTLRNVQQVDPIPLFGNMLHIFLGNETSTDYLKRVYRCAGNQRYIGIYQMNIPVLLVCDPELIKLIMVKDFDSFTNRREVIPDNTNPFWSKNLVQLKDEKWKEMRAKLSPSFTSTKMRAMFQLMNDTAQQFINYYEQEASGVITLDLKDAFSRYTNDVIANCIFGVQCDSLKDRNNEFYLIGRQLTDLTEFWKTMKIFLGFVSPTLQTLVNTEIIEKPVSDFFLNIIRETIKIRKENNIVRPDMINILMNCEGLNEIDITAQGLLFFFGGFDTVSTAMTFLAYELATNPDVQRKLQTEVDTIYAKHGNQLTYEYVTELKYLDMVVSETLRKWPPFLLVDRICTKPYIIKPEQPGESEVRLDAGDMIMCSAMGLHYDEKLYPEPERFNPERFGDTNKDALNPYSYLAFGIGPRNCIATRFAMLEVKTIIFHLMRRFNIVPVERSEIPVKLTKRLLLLRPENGMWLGLEKRELK